QKPPAPYFNWWQALSYANLRFLSLDTVVQDDFNFGINALESNAVGPTMFWPRYDAQGPGNNQGVFGVATGDYAGVFNTVGDALGVVAVYAGVVGSGYTWLQT